jgi:hypothetical protein
LYCLYTTISSNVRTSLLDMRVATKAAATTMETTILTVVEAFVILELNLVLCVLLQGFGLWMGSD